LAQGPLQDFLHLPLVFVRVVSLMALRPPLMPKTSLPAEPSMPPRLPKRRPPALGAVVTADPSNEPQSFSMATPTSQAATNANSRHYIGTPRADSILSAFLDFDEPEKCEDGPPLDFDDAMAALEAQRACQVGISASEDDAVAAVKCSTHVADAEDECDSSGSTRCSLADAGVQQLLTGDQSESDEEDYDDDFESESEYSDDGGDEEVGPIAHDAQSEQNLPIHELKLGTAGVGRTRSRGCRARSSSRTGPRAPGSRGHSRGAMRKSQSLTRRPVARSEIVSA